MPNRFFTKTAVCLATAGACIVPIDALCSQPPVTPALTTTTASSDQSLPPIPPASTAANGSVTAPVSSQPTVNGGVSAPVPGQPAANSAVSAAVPTPAAPAEVRGMWVVSSSITSPAAIQAVVAAARSHHFNTLFVQVRSRGDAMYRSTLEPRAEDLAGQPADFDPLQMMITDAHAAGLQVHAWVNTCYVWGDKQHRPISPEHVVNAHPDWFACDSKGRYLLGRGPECEGAFLTPANLAARQHIHDVFLEIVRNYDIDGIQFDYVRYPSAAYDYSTAALFRFQLEIDPTLSPMRRAQLHHALVHDRVAYAHAFPEAFQAFRREQITDMVRDISHDVKQIKPWVVVSADVFADYPDAYKSRGQDWKDWLRNGYVDAVAPMAYGENTQTVAKQVADAVSCAQACSRMVYAGIGAWRIPAASTIDKIQAVRALGATGEVLFSYGGVTHDGSTDAYLDKVGAQCYPSDAPIPTVPSVAPRPASTPSTQTGSLPIGSGSGS